MKKKSTDSYIFFDKTEVKKCDEKKGSGQDTAAENGKKTNRINV